MDKLIEIPDEFECREKQYQAAVNYLQGWTDRFTMDWESIWYKAGGEK